MPLALVGIDSSKLLALLPSAISNVTLSIIVILDLTTSFLGIT